MDKSKENGANMSVQVRETPQVSLRQLSPEKVELLKKTICRGGSDEDLELLIHACNRMGLDPFMRQIYSVPRRDYKTGTDIRTIQTGIDGYRLIAERTGKYIPGKQCTFVYDKNGGLLSATAYVKKLGPDNQWHEIEHTVYWAEYAAMKDGKPVAMWKDKPHVMLGKCAESACLRKAFPADLSGVYTKEEMEHADVEVVATSTPRTDANHAKDAKPEEKINEAQAVSLKVMIGDDKEGQEFLANMLTYLKIESLNELPLSKLDHVNKWINKHIREKLESAGEVAEVM